MSEQRGQAIVGVLVVMMLVFLLTGAVEVGSTTLLTRLRGPATAVDNDLAVRSAAAVAAGLALHASGCGLGSGGSRGQAFVTLPPSGDTRPAPVHAACVVADHALDQVSRMDVAVGAPGVCTTTTISSSQVSGRTDWWLLFAARFPYGGQAYVAPDSPLCQTSMRNLPKDRACSGQVPQPTASGSTVVALALPCTIPANSSLSLFVSGAWAGFPVYLVPHDTSGTSGTGGATATTGTTTSGTTGTTSTTTGRTGSTTTSSSSSFFLAAAGTGLAHPDVEEVLLFRPASSSSVPNPRGELRFEGAQP